MKVNWETCYGNVGEAVMGQTERRGMHMYI